MVERIPFLSLAMDLPPAPLYKDVMEKNIIPQAGCRGLRVVMLNSKEHHPACRVMMLSSKEQTRLQSCLPF